MNTVSPFSAGLLLIALVGSSLADNLAVNRLSLDGLGPLKIGMSAPQVLELGYQIAEPELGDINDCAQVEIPGEPGIRLMFEAGRISRIEIDSPDIRSISGARVGDTENEIKRLYGGRLVVQPHQYDENGHYLKIYSQDKRSSMVFETDGKVVTEMRAGPAAEYVEGCL